MYYHDSVQTKLACKYNVSPYVVNTIGEKYLNELYAVIKNKNELNWQSLSNSFVLKATHTSSLNLVVKDKRSVDRKKVEKILEKWLCHNQYKKVGYEWVYKNMKLMIVCERLLIEPGKEKLTDYKFFCFHGEPKFMQLDLSIGEERFRCFYDLNWVKLPFRRGRTKYYNGEFDKPKNFDEMKLLAKKLSNKLPFSRIDFYSISQKIIFGEITFYPADGKKDFKPDIYNKIIGDMLSLPNKKEMRT